MAWTAELTDVNTGTNAVSIRVKVVNDAVVVDPGPPIVYLTFNISRGYTNPDDITLANITAWIRTEITRIMNLYNKAETLESYIGTVITP